MANFHESASVHFFWNVQLAIVNFPKRTWKTKGNIISQIYSRMSPHPCLDVRDFLEDAFDD